MGSVEGLGSVGSGGGVEATQSCDQAAKSPCRCAVIAGVCKSPSL